MATNEDKLSLTGYLRKYQKQKDEMLKYDFMPSLLEIVERPAHRAGKVIIIVITFLLAVTLVWAALSRIDVVAVGTGSIIPEGRIQSVQSLTSGVVKSIKVKEGDEVKKGEELAALDETVTKQAVSQLKSSLAEIAAQEAVIQKYQENKQAAINLNDYDPVVQTVVKNLIAENTVYRQQLTQADAALATEQYESTLAQRLVTLEENKQKTETELAQQNYILEHLQIKAPTDGFISSVNINHIGQVVGADSDLVSIVPSHSELVFEGQVLDKDRANLKKGMKAVVKLQAYPYSDYGTIPAEVTYISPTAFQVKGQGMVYLVRVAIHRKQLNKDVKLISGLSGTVEIKTASRSILDYFLDPIRNGLDSSLKER